MSNWLSHDSIVGHIGGYGDKFLNPLSWVTKGKWTHLTSDVLPEKVNAGLSTVMKPFDKVDKTINPVRRIPIVNRAGDIIANKPGDALAIAAGAYFGGSALAGGMGGGAGGAAGVGEGGLTTASGFGGVGMDGGVAGIGEGGLSGGVGGGLVEGGVGGAGAGTADVGGLASLDSAAVDAEGAAPGLTEGYGPAETGGSSSTSNLQRQQQIGKMMQQMSQQQKQREIEASRVSVDTPNLQNPYATSSKTKKTAPTGNVEQAIARGAAGTDPIDTNGVQAAAIQEISKRLEAAKARLAELQKEDQ